MSDPNWPKLSPFSCSSTEIVMAAKCCTHSPCSFSYSEVADSEPKSGLQEEIADKADAASVALSTEAGSSQRAGADSVAVCSQSDETSTSQVGRHELQAMPNGDLACVHAHCLLCFCTHNLTVGPFMYCFTTCSYGLEAITGKIE